MTFTRAQRQVFDRDGVVELGPVLSAAEVDWLRRRLDALVLDGAGGTAVAVRDLSERLDGTRSGSVLQLVDVRRRDPLFASLTRNPTIVTAVAVLGPDVRVLRDQCFYKPPFTCEELYLHQDNRYWHLDPPQAVTVWIALDDATVENGCVHFIRGSHRLGRVTHRRAAAGTSILLEAVADKAAATPIEVRAGWATMHHCQLLHWSPPNRSSRPRRAHTVEYVAAGVTAGGIPVDGPLVLEAGRTLDV